MEEEYFTVREVADLFKLSEQAVYKIIERDSTIPVVKFGGSWRFDKKKLKHYLDNRTDKRFKESDA